MTADGFTPHRLFFCAVVKSCVETVAKQLLSGYDDSMPELSLSKSVLLTDYGLCINRYRLSTPGIYVCFHVPAILDDETRIVPGLVAQVNHGRLKQCDATEEGFLGPPNFVFDVFGPDEIEEYESRKASFERFGVTEYVVLIADEHQTCYWNRLEETDSSKKFVSVAPDEDGVIKSKALPGLWFSTNAAKERDWWTLVDLVERGITRLGHHEFMETIFHKEGRKEEWGDWLPFESG